MRRVRLAIAALFVVALVGGLAGAATPAAQHNWNCREVKLALFAKNKAGHTVCYPCPPELPSVIPALVEDIWQQEICAPAA